MVAGRRPGHRPAFLLDLLSAGLFLGVLTYGFRQLLYARRAAQANLEVVSGV